MTATTCTVRFATTGACGKPAVYTFTGMNGEHFGECAEHYRPQDHARVAIEGRRIGDRVEVYRHGKCYLGTVVKVTATGRVHAEVIYGNGSRRIVRL